MNRPLLLIPLGMSLPLWMSGCNPAPNERLAQFAEQSVQQQARQNEAMATNVQELTRATDELVKADASARQELLSASREQQAAFRQATAQIDQSRQLLDRERRALADERARETRSVTVLSALLVLAPVLLPFALMAYLLYLARQPDPDDAALTEVLLSELTSDSPRLFSAPIEPARLEREDSTDSREE
ncbi:hypothetical protein ETAA8_23230 [Anatilimnocola aggregata]|uniref:Uncharacterized protein n=1 Tax=Anatilimnocola aggregata TaxID=2528021 RepID=A0A517YAH3_9BACT|nr:hypothetical protein [Anatilimnocola aggregata]QDU27236.1 hypothetical protein ETAA8_23230 [Anatilimnocola aggregata]